MAADGTFKDLQAIVRELNQLTSILEQQDEPLKALWLETLRDPALERLSLENWEELLARLEQHSVAFLAVTRECPPCIPMRDLKTQIQTYLELESEDARIAGSLRCRGPAALRKRYSQPAISEGLAYALVECLTGEWIGHSARDELLKKGLHALLRTLAITFRPVAMHVPVHGADENDFPLRIVDALLEQIEMRPRELAGALPVGYERAMSLQGGHERARWEVSPPLQVPREEQRRCALQRRSRCLLVDDGGTVAPSGSLTRSAGLDTATEAP